MRSLSIVPSNGLLWLTAVVVLPASLLAGAAPTSAPLCLAAVAALAVIAAADAAFSFTRAAPVRVSVPPVVPVARGREFILRIELDPLPTATRAGVAWPEGLHTPSPVIDLGPGQRTIEWPMRALRRGRHRIDAIQIEAPSRFRLWLLRRSVPVTCEMRVFPDLRRERRGLAAVFLNRNAAGIHTQSPVGKGREFDHLRDYAAGDDYGDIHWKSTARRGRPVTKTFQIERTREIYAVIDHSRRSARATGVAVDSAGSNHATGGSFELTTQLERAIESALVLGLAAQRQHDLFGLVSFADSVTRFVRSSGGRAHYEACRNAVLTLEPRLSSPHFEDLFAFLRKKLTRRSLLIIMTDLSDPLEAEAFVNSVRLISKHHLVIVSMIRPADAHPLFSRSDSASVDDIYRDFAGHFLWHDLQELSGVLAVQGVHLGLPDSAALTVDVVTRYMTVRRRQIL